MSAKPAVSKYQARVARLIGEPRIRNTSNGKTRCCSLQTIIILVLLATLTTMTSLQLYMFYMFNLVPAESPKTLQLNQVSQLLGQAMNEVRNVEPSHLMKIFAPVETIGHDTNHAVLRVACIVIYEGPTLPSWFDSFAFTAQFTSSLVDWYIFVTDLPRHDFPPNVKIVRITNDDLYARIARALTAMDTDDGPNHLRGGTDIEFDLKYSLQVLLEDQPYMLVELKPVLGVIFQDYLTDYSHWGYADIDTVLGNMQLHLTPRMLQKYDVYTVSFGDTYRYYMRGQITIHRNDPYVNNIWRSCSSLSTLVDRLKTYMVERRMAKAQGKDVSKSVKWRFVSAEGCYSKAVAIHKNVSVLVSPGQISDAFAGTVRQREVFQIEDRLMRCFMHPVQLNSTKVDNAMVLSEAAHRKEEWIPLEITKKNCAYWVAPEFQVCLSYVPAGVEMRAENGVYEYNEQNFQYFVGGRSNCRLGFISHFQGWKNNYYKFTTRTPSLDNTNTVLYSSTGFIPLRLDVPTLSTYGELTGTQIPFGRIAPLDIILGMAAAASAGEDVSTNGAGLRIPRLMSSGSSHDSRGEVDGDGLVTQYCVGFTHNLKRCSCPLLGGHIEILRAHAAADNSVLSRIPMQYQTSLITVAWAEDYYDGRLDDLLSSWQLGPVIVVLAKVGEEPIDRKGRFTAATTTKEGAGGQRGGQSSSGAQQYRQQQYYGDATVIEVNLGGCLDHLKKPSTNESMASFVLPENVLFNIGLDAASTDMICVVPPAVSVAPLSTQSFKFSAFMGGEPTQDLEVIAQQLYLLVGKRVLLIPFDAPSSLSLASKDKDKDKNKNRCCHDHPEWLKEARSYLEKHGGKPSQPVVIHEVLYGTDKHGDHLKQMLFDNNMQLQPVVFNKRWSDHGSEFVRFPEELDGSQCHGHIVYAVMTGSGHVLSVSTLLTLTLHPARAVTVTTRKEEGEGVSEMSVGEFGGGLSQQVCGCMHGTDQTVGHGDNKRKRHARHLFIDNLRGYLKRAAEVRVSQLSQEYANEPYGYLFEHEQLELKDL